MLSPVRLSVAQVDQPKTAITNEGRTALSATELLRTESTFQRCIDYVDISGRSSAKGDLVSCVYISCFWCVCIMCICIWAKCLN